MVTDKKSEENYAPLVLQFCERLLCVTIVDRYSAILPAISFRKSIPMHYLLFDLAQDLTYVTESKFRLTDINIDLQELLPIVKSGHFNKTC